MFDNFQPIEHSLNKNISVLEVAVCQDKNIQGLLCRDKDILLADSENDVLYVIDYNGKLIEVVGQTGNAPLEFLHPTGIAEYMNNIYVLDAKNWVLSSIAVDEEGNIYMGSLDERYPYIICFHRSDNEFINLGQNFCGTVSEEAGKRYAINMGLVTEDKKTGIGIRTGKNYDDRKITKHAALDEEG